MTPGYSLEKWIWTEAEFDRMGWHDVRVHALAHIPERWELLLDLDYIFQWNAPEPGATHYTFWSAPATLVFANVTELRIDLEPLSALEIAQVGREDPRTVREGFHDATAQHWQWTLEFLNGAVQFRSTGYTQYVRRAPILNSTQYLTLEVRGGFSFDRTRIDPAA